jgi:hypothetical protein
LFSNAVDRGNTGYVEASDKRRWSSSLGGCDPDLAKLQALTPTSATSESVNDNVNMVLQLGWQVPTMEALAA